MSLKLINFLILAGLLLQVVVGGAGGSVGICLGGGHDHDQPESVSDCGAACSHGSAFGSLFTVAERGHDDRCPCTDLQFELASIAVPGRGLRIDIDAPEASPLPVVRVADRAESGFLGRPATMLDEDPGGLQRLMMVRATRLIL